MISVSYDARKPAVSWLKFEPMVSNFPVIKASVAFITKATMGSLFFWII